MKHNEPFEDDGRTVADMSGIEHDSIWLPRRRKQGHTPAQQPQQAADRPWEEDPQLTGKERLWAILGALKATLLICGVYLLGLLALLALGVVFWIPRRPLEKGGRGEAGQKGNRRPVREERVLGGLFLLCLLTVARIMDWRLTLGVVTLTILLYRPRWFRWVDLPLLATFVAFFVLIGNLGQVPAFRQLLIGFLEGREFLTALLASQVISNVPAAVLLSGFTDNGKALVLGTDIGGLGTLIASMASLISYGFFVRRYPWLQGYYLKIFTLANLAFLVVLAGIAG